MSAQAQKLLDTRALELAQDAKTVAVELRDAVHREFVRFEEINTRQHVAVADKQDRLRDLVNEKSAELHARIDEVSKTQAGDREKSLQEAIDGRDRRFKIVVWLFAAALLASLSGSGALLLRQLG